MADQGRSASELIGPFCRYELKSGEFNAARIHIFRAGEVRNSISRQQRSALTVTVTAHLRSIVAEIDENAVVVLSPVQGVFGCSYNPLEES